MSTQSWGPSVFDRLYADNADPWNFKTSEYERAKYAATLSALGDHQFSMGLELGCSIGVMTALLAPRCETLLAVDVAEAALVQARANCTPYPQVRFLRAALPDAFPETDARSCDLIVISELLYFLSPADIARLAISVARVAMPGAEIVLVNWIGPTDTPCTGDGAVAIFERAATELGLRRRRTERHESYRLDTFTL